MRQSTLILVNTLSVYVRILLAAPMGILSVRYKYGELEGVDYGLLTALGATTAFMTLFSNALIVGAERHLAFEIGGGDEGRVRSVFRAVFLTFLLIGAAVVVAGLALTPGVMRSLTIPPERTHAAYVVYFASLTSLASLAISTPFRAMLAANQRLTLISVLELLGSVGMFAGAFSLQYVTGDKLITFALIQLAINLASGVGAVAFAMRRYPASRSLPISTLADVKRIAGFAFWSFISNFARTIRTKGTIVAINVLFGPVANAAAALGAEVYRYLLLLAGSAARAVSPALTSEVGKQNHAAVERLANLSCKAACLITSAVCVPFFLETEQLLDLWQATEVPPDTAIHVRWLCLSALLGTSGWGHSLTLNAYNRVAKIALIRIGTITSTLAIAWFGCKYFGWPAWAITATVCVPGFLQSLTAVPWLAADVLGKSYREVMKSSALPALGVFVPCFLLTTAVWWFAPAGLLRIPLIIVVYLVLMVPAAWRFALNRQERESLAGIGARVSAKLFPKSAEPR